MAIEGFKLEIDKTGRAVISTPKSQGSTSVDTRPTTLTSPSKLASLPATRATTPMQQHTASSQRLSQHGSDVDARREAGGDEQEQDDEGRTLLKQFTFASPSPKRKREASSSKRKKKVVRLEKAEVGRDDAEEGTKSYSRTRRLQTNPFSPHRVQSTYELPVPPHLIFATPAAPPPPHRLPSISTTLRPSLELGERDDFAEPSPNVTHVAPAALLAPPSPSPTLAADLLQLLERQGELPEGLMDLLEACVAEGKAALQSGERSISALASTAGVLTHAAFEPTEVLRNPPGHSRSVSLSSAFSSTSLPSLNSSCSSSFSAPSSDSSDSSYHLSRHSIGVVDRLSACPPIPHPDYPRSFGRPLRFIFETGLESYEEQREGRNHLPDDTPPPRKKQKRAGRAKWKGWGEEEEEEEGDDGGSAYVSRSGRYSAVHTLMGEDYDADGYELRRSTRVRKTK